MRLKNVIFIILLFVFLPKELHSLGIYGREYYQSLYTIYIENKQNGPIYCYDFSKNTWEVIGLVLYPCEQVNTKGFTASKWAKPSSIAASSVNAIHIKTADNTIEGRGVVFSVLPYEMLFPIQNYNSFLSPDSSIYTNIEAGSKIFGGEFSPFVGNTVLYQRNSSSPQILPDNYVPKIGDTIIIKVFKPRFLPKSIIFENKEDGLVKAVFLGDQEEIIGKVIRPVRGVGRFSGTRFCDVGRIRANHTGVIDVSTSDIDKIGGFQIIPSYHSLSAEMANAYRLTQWMIVAPIEGKEQFLEGMPPLFLGYIRPVDFKKDLLDENWINDALKKYLVDVKLEGSNKWQNMPEFELDSDLSKELPEFAANALANVTHIRILFPVELIKK